VTSSASPSWFYNQQVQQQVLDEQQASDSSSSKAAEQASLADALAAAGCQQMTAEEEGICSEDLDAFAKMFKQRRIKM
jgi:hypothetical protein